MTAQPCPKCGVIGWYTETVYRGSTKPPTLKKVVCDCTRADHCTRADPGPSLPNDEAKVREAPEGFLSTECRHGLMPGMCASCRPAPDNAQQGAREGDGTRHPSYDPALIQANSEVDRLTDQLADKDAKIKRLKSELADVRTSVIWEKVGFNASRHASEIEARDALIRQLRDALRKVPLPAPAKKYTPFEQRNLDYFTNVGGPALALAEKMMGEKTNG